MRERSLGVAAWLLVVAVGCGGRDGTGPLAGRDAGRTADSSTADAGMPARDGEAREDDAGPRPDGGPVEPEVCSGGLDEDGDVRTDCDDDDCWAIEACAAEHVARSLPGLHAC